MLDQGRRQFITLLGGTAATWPFTLLAQTDLRVWRVAYLGAGSESDVISLGLFEIFKLKLRDLGYIEGRNLILDVRRAAGDFSRLPALAADLVALKPDVIAAVTTPAVLAVKRATSTIPIVMGPTADPIGSGIVTSLANPGGNITGVSIMSTDLSAKSLEFLTALVPSAKRVAALMSTNPVHQLLLKELQMTAQAIGLTVVPIIAVLPTDLDSAFARMATEGCDGVVVLADARLATAIPDLAAKTRLPTIYQFSDFVRYGGLLGYGPNLEELYRRAGHFRG